MLPTIKQIREANGGLDNLTDFEIAQHQHQQYKAYVPDFNRFAQMVGVDTGTKWGNRWGAAVDSAQASLAGVGESALDIEGLRGVRVKNNLDARNSRQFARSQGAIMESGQVDGVGSALEYVGGLAVDTAPQMAATLGAGALGTLAAGPVGGAAAAGSVGYTFALGDILENQREQSGTTDVRSAAALALPYAAVDTFTGVGGTLLKMGKGTLPKAGLNLLDKTLDGVQGIKGAALRTGVNVGKASLAEGAGETFQEGMNQLGRMAVDPNETFLNDRSAEAFKESFIGGAALGGAIGGAAGGWRRSEGYQAPIDENGGVNLLNGQPLNPLIPKPAGLQLGYDPTAGNDRLITFPDGTTAFPEDVPERRAQLAAQDHPGFVERPAEYPEVPLVSLEQAALAEDKAKIEAAQAVQAEAKDLGIKGKGISLYRQLKQALDDGVITEADFRDQRVQLGANGNTDVARFLKGAYAASEARSVTQAAAAQEQAGLVESMQGRAATAEQEAAAMAAEWEAALIEQGGVPPAQAAVQAGRGTAQEAAAQQGAVAVAQPNQPRVTYVDDERRNWSTEPGAIAGIAPDKTAEVGRSGRKKALTPAQVLEKIKKASPRNKKRILAVTGMDMVVDPTTGAPKLVISGNPMTLDEVADAESKDTGKKVSKQAISQTLADAGIDADVATRVASPDLPAVYSDADLEIAPSEDGGAKEGSGFRIESAASKATNQGVIYDEVTGNAHLNKMADLLLKGKITPEQAAQVSRYKSAAVQPTLSGVPASTPVELEQTAPTESKAATNSVVKSSEGRRVVKDSREDTPKIIEQRKRELLNHPDAANAESMWDTARISWGELPDALKADWVGMFVWNRRLNDGEVDGRALARDQVEIERDFYDWQDYGGQQGTGQLAIGGDTGAGSRADVVDGAEAARPELPAPPAGPAPEVIEVDGAPQREVTAPRPYNVASLRGERGVLLEKFKAWAKNNPLRAPKADEVNATLNNIYARYKARFPAENNQVAANAWAAEHGADIVAEWQTVIDTAMGVETVSPTETQEAATVEAALDAQEAAPADNTSAEDQRVAQENAARVVVKKKRTVQKPVDLEDPAVATAETVEAKPVVQPRNTTPGTVGATVAGQPVSANVGPGFTANDVVKGAPAKDAAPATVPDWAEAAARSVGGTVVFHNDEVALVRGYSEGNGKHLYAGVHHNGSRRTRVDINDFTGNIFTPDQLSLLRSESRRLAAEDYAKMAENPDGPFAPGETVAATSSVPSDVAGYLRGLLDTLNMKGVRVFLLTPEEARTSRDSYKLYGDYAAAESAGLDANEDGSMRRFGPNKGDFYISMRPGLSPERAVELVAHEVGHIVEKVAYDKADADTKAEIKQAYREWLVQTKRMTAPEIIQALRNRATAEAHVKGVDEDSFLSSYWTSFEEWFADNVSRWATTSEKPMSLVDKFFSAVAATIRKLAASITGRTYVPNPVVARFLDGMANGSVKTVPWSDDTAASQSAAPTQSVAQQLGPQYAKAETALTRAIGDLKTAAVKYGAFTRDLIDQAAKLMPVARKYLEHYEAVATDRTRMEQRVDAVLERFATLNTHERTRVNEVIRTSTMSKEWAFKPDWLKNAKYDENSDVARAFRALTPVQRGVIQDVFRHGHDTLEAMQKAVKDNVNSEFDVLIKGFRDAGNMDEAAKAEARKAKALTEFSSMLEMNGNWPYAPLRRFGDHVVVAKSAAYRAAELADDKAQIKELEADENHYYVEFFESRGEARKKVADMQATGKYAGGEVENFNKGNANEQLYGGRDMFNAFRRLRGLVNETGGASLSEPANATINKLMNDLYLSLLGERSARQAERNRKNTAGADRDMMRAFATKGRADAHFIASLRFGGQVQEDLLKMKKEADEGPNGGTRELRREYFNEILARHTMQMDFQSTPVVDKVMATSSLWQLLFNPAYYLQNVMQPWVMSLPMLAGKHGYGKSWSALARAYRDLGPLIKDGAFSKGDYDALPADVQSIVKDLAARGRIEITLEHDLGQWNSNVDDGRVTRTWTKVTKGLSKVNSRLEMLNRLATGIAAARLEGVGNAKNATDYADRVIIGTHGDYNAFNAPRLMRTPLGRMATQFRKFQLIQITMYTKLVADALKGASPDERAVARRVLAYNLGHMAVLGGAMGLPGFQLFSMVLGSIFGDDDEPDDAEATLRRIMGNGPVTDALTRGVPNAFGVDLSGKVGSGNMLSLFPYADWDIESRSGYQNLLAAAAGPFVGGLMPKWADAVGTAKQGDYYKALEKVLPGLLGNAIKGTRFAVDGVTTTRGVQAMSADEITWVDGTFQAFGLPTSTITDRNFRSGAEYKASKFFDEKSSQVKKDYVEAFQDNDTDAMAEARQEWLDMQATRKRLGLTVQPLSQLIKAPRERMKRDRMAVGGVAADKETQGFVKNLME